MNFDAPPLQSIPEDASPELLKEIARRFNAHEGLVLALRNEHEKHMSLKTITVRLDNDDEIIMTADTVQWFSFGLCVGHVSMEEFLDFLKEKLADIKHDASQDHGEDAASEPPEISDT